MLLKNLKIDHNWKKNQEFILEVLVEVDEAKVVLEVTGSNVLVEINLEVVVIGNEVLDVIGIEILEEVELVVDVISVVFSTKTS